MVSRFLSVMAAIWFSSFAFARRNSRMDGTSVSPSLVKRNAVVVAPDERQADIALQTVYQVRQSRLRVADDLRCLREASEVNGGHKNFKLFAVHKRKPPAGMTDAYDKLSYTYYNPAISILQLFRLVIISIKELILMISKKTDYPAEDSGGRNPVRYVLWRRQPDLPRSPRTAGRTKRPTCHDWFYHHCRRHSHFRRSSHRRNAFRRLADVIEQGRQGLRRVLHVPSVPHHRSALFAIPRCATTSFTTGVTPMLTDASREPHRASHLLGHFLRICSLLLAQTRQNHSLDWQDHQSRFSCCSSRSSSSGRSSHPGAAVCRCGARCSV